MKRPVVAVSGMNAVDSPGPGVPVLRSLRESKLNPELIGFAYGALEPGNFMSDLLENSFLLPYPSSGPEVLLAAPIYCLRITGRTYIRLLMFISFLDIEQLSFDS